MKFYKYNLNSFLEYVSISIIGNCFLLFSGNYVLFMPNYDYIQVLMTKEIFLGTTGKLSLGLEITFSITIAIFFSFTLFILLVLVG